MRVACVIIPHFYVQAARRNHPELGRKPFIIGGVPEEKGHVVDCSEDLTRKGIFPSMPLKDARRLLDDVTFIPFEGKEYRLFWNAIFSALMDITVRVEADSPGAAFLDLARLPGTYKSEEQLSLAAMQLVRDRFSLAARVGVGSSRFVASEAAGHAAPHVLVIPPGGEKKFLSPLGVERLPVSSGMKERLALLGLNTLGHIHAFPLSALLSQFGAEGKALWELARGIENRGRIPGFLTISEIEEDMILDSLAYSREQIRAALQDLLDKLCTELEGVGMACRMIELTLYLRNKERCEKHFVFHSPVACKDDMLRRITSGLEYVELQSPVHTMSIRASALSPCAGRQEMLFRMRKDFSTSLNEIGSFLRTKYGCMPVVRVRENNVNTLLPDQRFIFVES
jgi:DNA polymerase IV